MFRPKNTHYCTETNNFKKKRDRIYEMLGGFSRSFVTLPSNLGYAGFKESSLCSINVLWPPSFLQRPTTHPKRTIGQQKWKAWLERSSKGKAYTWFMWPTPPSFTASNINSWLTTNSHSGVGTRVETSLLCLNQTKDNWVQWEEFDLESDLCSNSSLTTPNCRL